MEDILVEARWGIMPVIFAWGRVLFVKFGFPWWWSSEGEAQRDLRAEGKTAGPVAAASRGL
jgi:hypothetical protein